MYFQLWFLTEKGSIMKKTILRFILSVLVLIFSITSSFASEDADMHEPEYDNSDETPIFTVACFSDLHIDYGIQSWENPIRLGTVSAVDMIRDEFGKVDVVLVGGDITSNNGGNTWTSDIIINTIDTVYNTLSLASKDGKVLFVSGNHENEAGIIAGNTEHSGDYEMYMLAALGDFKDTLYLDNLVTDSVSEFNEMLCYRYTVNNMEFIGINTPYRPERSDGYIYPEQIEWVEEQLVQIGKDKTVIIFCHYPLNNISTPSGYSADSGELLTGLLEEYPNVIYCYGHVHGADEWQVKYNTSELVEVHGDKVLTDNNAYETDGFITCHMGSMGFYKNSYQPDWLSIDEPVVVQLMTISFYSNHITFRMHNTGEEPGFGGSYDIASFTVMRDLKEQFKIAEPVQTEIADENTESENDGSGIDPALLIIIAASAVLIVVLVTGAVFFRSGSKKQKQ